MYKFTQSYTSKMPPVYVQSVAKPTKMLCDDDNDNDDDEEYIEVPGGSDTVEWTDEETGTTYEVDIDDLIEYDGDDEEIQYTKSKKPAAPLKAASKFQDRPLPILNMLAATQQRVYA